MSAPNTLNAPARRRAAFGFIFVSAVASAMSIGIMVPILPNLLKQFTGGDTAGLATLSPNRFPAMTEELLDRKSVV